MGEPSSDRLRRELEDSSPDVWRRILIALLEERKDEESFQAAKGALEAALAEGEDALLLWQYGYVHECRGLLDEAIRWYERSLVLDPEAEKTHGQLIGAYAAVGRAKNAVERYERRLEAAPADVGRHRLLAAAYLAAGRHEEAGNLAERGLALAPGDPHLLLHLGAALEARGRPDDALRVWQRAIELDGEFVDPRYNRVFLLQRLGREQEAAAEWEGIVGWLLERGFEVEAEWPKRELERLRGGAS